MTTAMLRETIAAANSAVIHGANGHAAYDFRRPERISREQLHALHFLHDRCARNMSTSFSAYLRTTISLSVASVDQLAYDEFLGSVADPTAFYALGIAPFDELGALDMSPSIAFAMLDRMLGGSGQPMNADRPLTEIEQNVIDSVVKLLLEGLAEAWKPVTNLGFSIRARETRPQMLQIATPNEAFVVVRFKVQVGETAGTVSVCIPVGVVEEASAQFMQAWPKNRRDMNAADRAHLAEHIARATVPVTPMIRATMPAAAVLALKPGEVVALPLAADRPIDVYVGSLKKLTGRLAADRGRLKVIVEERAGLPMSLAPELR